MKQTKPKSSRTKKATPFAPTIPRPDFVAMEKARLDWWYRSGVVEKYLHKNDSSKQNYSFLDGPITANNPMGVHHAWGRTLKDLYQRYHNMKGEAQRFQNGFDNQGLWVEVQVEKELGFQTKKDIEEYGIAEFVEKCKERTLHFAQVQTDQSKRLGYFMDWDNSYYTMADENNYMIWSFLKKCHHDGNLYKGRDSVPWCPRCGTAISQHEILTEEYQELTHDSIYFELPVQGRENERLLVWTTTPWTLPANVALAVHPDFDYSLVTGATGINFWLVSTLAKKLFGADAKVIKTVKGKDLVGLRYTGPFDHLPVVQEAAKEKPATFHTVVPSTEYVNDEEGTGIVHIAPGCGQEDFLLGKETGLPVINAIDEAANYLPGFGDLAGKNAKDTPDLIFKHPALYHKYGNPAADYVFEIKPYTHRYPVCWRCKTELVWRVVDEWYIAMDDTNHKGAVSYRQKMIDVIKKISWIPKFGYDRELDWLRNMHDWLISKKRYWGLALPIWVCEKCESFEVIGSREELKKKAIAGWKEFDGHTPHRPWVDRVKIKCAKCGGTAARIPDVGNPWLDAGIVTYSTLNYRTDKTYWEKWFPANLILECFPGQFKNWFYSMIAMSTVLENREPTKTVFGHALVRDESGEEMHKSKGNAIEFNEAAETIGVDTMRWLYSCQNPTLNLNFGFHIGDEVRRRFILLLWNVYHYFVTYANIDQYQARERKSKRAKEQESKNVLDQWILVRLNETVEKVEKLLDKYQHHVATEVIEKYVEDLSTWWLRRSRDRMGPTAPDGADKQAAYATFFTVLTTLSKILAPFVPFLAEEMFQNLKHQTSNLKRVSSVHLDDWPKAKELTKEEEQLLADMETVREIVELGHAARKAAGVKVRQSLSKLQIPNSKFQNAHKRFQKQQKLLDIAADELNMKNIVFVAGEGEVELDTKLSPELVAEGNARELVRQIQEMRKQESLALDEKIVVYLPKLPESMELQEYVKQKTLADRLEKGTKLAIEKVV